MPLWMNGYFFILRLPLTFVLSRIDIIDTKGINSYGHSYLFTAEAVIGDIDKWLWFLVSCPSNVSHVTAYNYDNAYFTNKYWVSTIIWALRKQM